ncbi:MAG: pyroglutamyl-peptidase I [Burkholderiaceae bacterium]
MATPLHEPCALVTGFEPFGGETINPSWMAAQALHGRVVGGHRIVAACLPTVFGESLQVLSALLARHRPALVIGLGQAGGRTAVSLERVAINVNDARIPDNAKAQPVDTEVVEGGPAAYFTTLPVKAMLKAMQEAGVPAEVSQTAGTFVCNHAFYGLMHALAKKPPRAGARGGFIHVPLIPSQGTPALPLETIVRGLEVAIAAAAATRHDIVRVGGALN